MYKQMKKAELIKYAETKGLINISNKTKEQIIEQLNKLNPVGISCPRPITEPRHLDIVLNELLTVCPKDKARKVCKECNELGHNKNSPLCQITIEYNKKLSKKIKKYILEQDCLDDKPIEDYIKVLSEKLETTENHIRSLYNNIPPEVWLDRPLNIDKYLETIENEAINCGDCNKKLYNSHANSNRKWKQKILCDICWSKYSEERNKLWCLIQEYKPVICYICGITKMVEQQRFNYDHINMFDKSDSICSLVNDGCEINDIYKEIDKCQIVCFSCHHKITDLETKLGFNRIKKNLTRQLNSNEIGETDYISQITRFQSIYKSKMSELYDKLRATVNKS